MGTASSGRALPDARGVELQAVAESLFEVLSDGHPALRYNICDGYALVDRRSGGVVKTSLARGWQPAREIPLTGGAPRDRLANPYVLARHIEGGYHVAIEAPSWCRYIVLDIDATDDGRHERTLASVWRALELDAGGRQPVILRSPGGGYHVYFPFDRHWPLAWARQWFEHALNQAGIGLQSGVLELYPSGVPLRAPCGRGMALLVPRNPMSPSDLQLEMQHAEWVTRQHRVRLNGLRATADAPRFPVRTLERRPLELARAFVEQFEAARRPLEEWLSPCPAAPAWDADKWGPFGKREKKPSSVPGGRALNRHIGEVLGGLAARPGLPSGSGGKGGSGSKGLLLYGSLFWAEISSLLHIGISRESAGHDGALKVAFYLRRIRGLSAEEVLVEVERWLRGGVGYEGVDHQSRTRRVKGVDRWVRETLREVRQYVERHLAGGNSRPLPSSPRGRPGKVELGAQDDAMLRAVTSEEVRWAARAILGYVASFADPQGRVPHPVDLSSAVLEVICGQARVVDAAGRKRRASVVALEELRAAGVVTVHGEYSVAHHARRYAVWYSFGSGIAPKRDDELGVVVLGRRTVEEGDLVCVVGEEGRAEARLRTPHALEDVRPPWWRRMYERRAFTPAEFFDADERHVLAGPFRDRRETRRERTPDAPQPAIAVVLRVSPPLPAGGRSGVCGARAVAPDSAALDPFVVLTGRGAIPPPLGAAMDNIAEAEVTAVQDPALRALLGHVWAAWRSRAREPAK